ncbi:hypothetical protein D9M68_801830 [compost metagenome]
MAWATMAVPACCRICERDRLAVSLAKSASMMRPREAERFSTPIWMLATAFSKRLCTAPSLARAPLTWSSASSSFFIAM